MSDEEIPEGLEDFVSKIFGGKENADEFAQSMEDPMVEAWKGIYEVYLGLRSGGFTISQANGVMGSYLYNLISSMEGN